MSDADDASDVPEPTSDGNDEHESASEGEEPPLPAPPADNRAQSKKRSHRAVMATLAAIQGENAKSTGLLKTIGEGIADLVRLAKRQTRAPTAGNGSAIETAPVDGNEDAPFSLENPSQSENQGFTAHNSEEDDDASSHGYGYGGDQSSDVQPFADNQAAEAARNREEGRKDAAKARRAARRTEWNKAARKAHWILTGAPPIPHNQSVMQGILDKRVKVSTQVQKMLAELTMFKVRAFVPRDVKPNVDVPINERMYIMGQAVVNLARKSVPTVPQVSGAERATCLARVKKLYDSFNSGLKLLTQHCEEYRDLVSEPETAALIAAMIDKDMAEWTKRIHTACATNGPTMYEPPESASELPPVMVPVWKHLAPFLNSGSLAVASVRATKEGRRNRSASTEKSGSPGKSKDKAEDCRRFAEGRCHRTDCRYRHRNTGDADGNKTKGGHNKREKPDADASTGKKPAKKAKAAAATKTAGATPEDDESE